MTETTYFVPVVCVALAYLLGSLAFAVLVSRAMGLSDPLEGDGAPSSEENH